MLNTSSSFVSDSWSVIACKPALVFTQPLCQQPTVQAWDKQRPQHWTRVPLTSCTCTACFKYFAVNWWVFWGARSTQVHPITALNFAIQEGQVPLADHTPNRSTIVTVFSYVWLCAVMNIFMVSYIRSAYQICSKNVLTSSNWAGLSVVHMRSTHVEFRCFINPGHTSTPNNVQRRGACSYFPQCRGSWHTHHACIKTTWSCAIYWTAVEGNTIKTNKRHAPQLTTGL